MIEQDCEGIERDIDGIWLRPITAAGCSGWAGSRH